MPGRCLLELGGDDFVMLCWEQPGEFCHRLVVAAWLQKELGVVVEEFNPKLRQPPGLASENGRGTGIKIPLGQLRGPVVVSIAFPAMLAVRLRLPAPEPEERMT